MILSAISEKFSRISDNDPIMVDRHRASIRGIYKESLKFQVLIENEAEISILAHELNGVGNRVTDLIGIFSTEDILASVFDNFCIGK